jgi:hypothetical protein
LPQSRWLGECWAEVLYLLLSQIGMISDRLKYCRKASRAPISFNATWSGPKAGRSIPLG